MSSRRLDDTDDGGSSRRLGDECCRGDVIGSVVGMNECDDGEDEFEW